MMIGDRKRPHSEQENIPKLPSAAIEMLHTDPLMFVFHQLSTASFVGNDAIHSVCKIWNTTLNKNGSWQKKKSPLALINTSSLEEMIKLFQNGEAFKLLSFKNILELLNLHPEFTTQWTQQRSVCTLLNEEELEELNIRNDEEDVNKFALFPPNTKQWIDDILKAVHLHLPATILPNNLQILAMSNHHIALYVLEHFETYDEQLSDTILTSIGESHPLVAKKILEVPELYERLDGQHFVSLCADGQAALTNVVLTSPILREICTEEDIAEINRMAAVCKNLQDFSLTYKAKVDNEDAAAPVKGMRP